VGRNEILELLLSVRAQTTVLFSTHILADVERICTDVALLHEGKIAMQGSVEALKRLKRREEFAVEATDSAALAGLKAAFPEASVLSEDTLLFAGDNAKMHTVMAHIAENGISVRRVERAEASLEALFMEVTNA
jgi:ABC-2 type transport system ATP-binding protein